MRLNEALIVSFGAMALRELDRHHGGRRRRARNRSASQAPGKPRFRSQTRPLSHPRRACAQRGAGSCRARVLRKTICGGRPLSPPILRRARAEPKCAATRWKASIREPKRAPTPASLSCRTSKRKVLEPSEIWLSRRSFARPAPQEPVERRGSFRTPYVGGGRAGGRVARRYCLTRRGLH
jgi:hypothetical protein